MFKRLLSRRPAEIISGVIGLLVAIGFVTTEEGSALNEAASAAIVAVGLVSAAVTTVVARYRKS